MSENSDFFTEEFDFNQRDFEYATGGRHFKRQTKEQEIYGWFEITEWLGEVNFKNLNCY